MREPNFDEALHNDLMSYLADRDKEDGDNEPDPDAKYEREREERSENN